MDSTFTGVEKRPRLWTFFTLSLAAIQGVVLGAASAWSVIGISAIMLPPWTYVIALGITLAVKVALAWLKTLVIEPFTQRAAVRRTERRTGKEVPPHVRPSHSNEGSTLTVTAVATIAMAIYLTTLDADAVAQVSSQTIWLITAMTGSLVALSESLSRRIVILALRYNRFEYQDHPLYQQSLQQPKPSANNRTNPRGSQNRNRPRNTDRR